MSVPSFAMTEGNRNIMHPERFPWGDHQGNDGSCGFHGQIDVPQDIRYSTYTGFVSAILQSSNP